MKENLSRFSRGFYRDEEDKKFPVRVRGVKSFPIVLQEKEVRV